MRTWSLQSGLATWALCCALHSSYGQAPKATAPLAYDLLIQHGRVLDAKNGIDAVMDVAVKDGKVTQVAPHLRAEDAKKVVDAIQAVPTDGRDKPLDDVVIQSVAIDEVGA